MKKIITALLIITFFSCQKENEKTESKSYTTVTDGYFVNDDGKNDSIYNKVAYRIDPDQPKPPTYISLMTVVVQNTYTFKFTWTFSLLPNGHGGGNLSIGGATLGMITGGFNPSNHNFIPGIIYWTNYPNSTRIYFTCKAKDSYYILIREQIDHVSEDIFYDGWVDTNTGKSQMSVHIVGQHFIK